MTRIAAAIGLVATATFLTGAAFAGALPETEVLSVQVNVTSKEMAEQPVSPLIYGGFIESGFGRQVEGMWAEMLFNRGFETIPPYTGANYGSRGCGPETEVEKQPWWHSGYEEPPWELAPGNPQATWSTPSHFGFWKGMRAGWLKNKSTDQWAGFAQRGIHLRRGESYAFSGFLRTGHHEWDTDPDDMVTEAEIRIYPEGDWSKPILTHKLKDIRKAFTPHTCVLDNPDFEGRAIFSIWIPPESILGADDLSLMPASNLHGWRADVVEVSRRVNPRLIRWPGGCFASFYRWRDGIGPRSERRAVTSWFWGGLYDNDVGTAEFAQFCRLLDAEPFICVNVLTGSADEAADWVAYCNAPAEHAIGRLRARDGFPEPFGVKYWELDNETGRRFTTAQYAQRCVEFAQAMRAVDPAIRIAVVGYDWHRIELSHLLETAGPYVDFIVDRAIDEAALRRDLDEIRAYNRSSGRQIRLCNTEWPAPERDVPPTVDRNELERIPTAKGRRRCWYSALNVAKTLLTFQRLGGDLAFSNFNNFANTWGQNVIECPKDNAYLSPAGHVFELFSRSPAAWPLELKLSQPRENVIVQAAWNESRTALCLIVLNYNAAEAQLSFALDQLDKRFANCELTVMRAESLTAYASPADTCVVQREDLNQTLSDGAKFELTTPQFSLIHAVLK
jgi:alpha-N-arabinofuranosidase